MQDIDPVEFAKRWQRHWNEHDIEAVLRDFAEDVVFTSPLAAQIVPGSDGVVRGKPALARYWAEGLRLHSGLRFDVTAVYAGVNTLVIVYSSNIGDPACDVLTFEGPLVVVGHGTRLSVPSEPQSADPQAARASPAG
jgi:SnoaL-like domain